MNHTRHMGIFQIPSTFSVTLIGAGGIGATTALTLAKMGVRILQIFDDDTVSEENIPTQLHVVSDVGDRKVNSLARTLRLYSDEIELYPVSARVTSDRSIRSSLVISAVDSITARQDIWRALNNQDSAWDTILTPEWPLKNFRCLCFDTGDTAGVVAYEEASDGHEREQRSRLPCTAKATFFCGNDVGWTYRHCCKEYCTRRGKVSQTGSLHSR